MEEKKQSYLQKNVFSKIDKFLYLGKKAFYFAWYRHHFLIPPRVLKQYAHSFFVSLKRGGGTSNLFTNQEAYNKVLEEQRNSVEYEELSYTPLISFIVPTYNVSKQLLSECLESLLQQSYKNFEICISDDHSSSEETITTLKEYESKYSNIHVVYRNENGMISEASNTAIGIAKGEFIALVDNDDVVEKDALYFVVKALNDDKSLDMIYTDEDKIDFKGKYMEPHFKPDYSPDTLMGINYICHLCVLRRSIVNDVGGFRKEYDGSQDYDLFLRVLDKTDRVYHVDRVLYHWRQTPGSTAGYLGNKNYAYIAGKKVLEDTLKRRGIKGEVLENPRFSGYLVKYAAEEPLISIIIPMKDQASVSKRCFESLYTKNVYKNFEIIVVDNGSKEKETRKLFEEYSAKNNFKVIRIDTEFNYAYLNNEGVKQAKGEYLLFLNNDTEIIQEDTLSWMVGYASQQHVGCVGAKLLYPDKKVQHAGVVLGFGGVAGHIYVANSYNDNGLFGRLAMPYNYTAVTAACLMLKKSKFEEAGGFDENLKVALNDVDLNLSVMSKGYNNVCLSNVEVLHYESKSRGYEVSSEKQERFKFEQQHMMDKWGEILDRDKYFSKYSF